MKKIILIFVLLCFVSLVLAETREEDFDIDVQVKIANNYCNITVGDYSNSYSCNSTYSSTFHPTIKHEFEYDCQNDQVIYNFSNSVDKMAETCKIMQDSYKDVSSYYDQYVTCKSQLSACEKERDNYKQDAVKKDEAINQKDICNKQLINMERDKNEFESKYTLSNSSLTTCELKNKDASSNKIVFFIGGVIVGAGALYWFKIRPQEVKTTAERELQK